VKEKEEERTKRR